MFSLLNPTIWLVALAILAGSSGLSYFKGRTNGTKICEAAHAAAKVAANEDARKLEQARQRRADESAKLAAAREVRIRLDADRARNAVGILRGTLDSVERRASESRAAADNAVRALSNVVGECGSALVEVSQDADRARSEVKTLRDAWPR